MLGSDALKLTTSKVITMVISLVSTMLLSRFRSLEEYGTYSQILTVTSLGSSLLMLGLPNSINYFLAQAKNNLERQRFLSTYYIISTILSMLVGMSLVFSTPIIVQYFNNELINNFIYFFALYPWTTIIASSIENVLIVYKKPNILVIYKILNSFALLSIILITQTFKWSFSTYMLLFIFVQSIFAVTVYGIVKNISGKIIFLFDIVLIRKVFTFSIPIGLASVVGTLNIELDKLMIGNFLGTEQLAIYTNASKEMPVTIVASSLTAVLMPQLVRLLLRGENRKAINLWGHATILAYIIICFFSTVFFVFAPDIMTLMYSEKYLAGISVFRIFNVVLLLRCTYFAIILNSKGKTKFILYSSVAALTLNALLNYLFFYILGFEGPAWATLASTFIIALCQLIATSRIVKISFRSIFPWKEIFRITLINVILGIIFILLKKIISLDYLIGELLESIVLGIFWSIVYFRLLINTLISKWNTLNTEDI